MSYIFGIMLSVMISNAIGYLLRNEGVYESELEREGKLNATHGDFCVVVYDANYFYFTLGGCCSASFLFVYIAVMLDLRVDLVYSVCMLGETVKLAL